MQVLIDAQLAIGVQWNLSILDMGPNIFSNFLLQHRVFPLLEVKNALVTPVEVKIFCTYYGGFSIVFLI